MTHLPLNVVCNCPTVGRSAALKELIELVRLDRPQSTCACAAASHVTSHGVGVVREHACLRFVGMREWQVRPARCPLLQSFFIMCDYGADVKSRRTQSVTGYLLAAHCRDCGMVAGVFVSRVWGGLASRRRPRRLRQTEARQVIAHERAEMQRC